MIKELGFEIWWYVLLRVMFLSAGVVWKISILCTWKALFSSKEKLEKKKLQKKCTSNKPIRN